MKTNNTPANVATLLTAAAYVRNETIINGNQAAQLDAMIGQIKDLTTKIEAVPAKIAALAAQGKEKAVAMWKRMATRYQAQFADAVATLRAWLVDFKAHRPNVQINLDESEDPAPATNNTPNVSDLARWIDLQLSTIIDGISAGYTLGNYNSVWIDKGSTVFNVSLSDGETVEIDSDNYNTAEEIASAIISTINNTSTMNANEVTNVPEFSQLSHAATNIVLAAENTQSIYAAHVEPLLRSLERKAAKGVTLSLETLAKSYAMAAIIRESIKKIKRTSYDPFSAKADDRRAAALYLANIYIGDL